MDSGLTGAVFANSRPRALGALMRSFRDLDMAEDLYQEACLRATERWRQDGVPRDPTAWLITVARNAGLDRIRKNRRMVPLDATTVLEAQSPDGDHHAEIAEAIDRQEYKDDVLRLMFLCCHPELKSHEQLALALKVVVGFSVEEIARAFVVTPDTMQRRLSRAKARAAGAAAALETPSLAERAERLSAVQTMIYLMFNEGYGAASGNEHIRMALCDEAIRLARLLLDLFPAQVELMGLLALCLLQHARAPARIDGQGRLVSLEEQDRMLWDETKIAEGRMLVEKALRHGRPGPLQVQAAIAAVHCAADNAQHTDWAEIERLYRALEVLAPSPVVRLNRAVAVSKLDGPSKALAMLEPLADELQRYRPYHSVRAAFLEENGDIVAAIAALEEALKCHPTRQEAEYLTDRIGALKENHALCPIEPDSRVSYSNSLSRRSPMPHDPHRADQMRDVLASRPGIAEKKMFGGYCWMLNGNMLCGVEVGRFMFRVGKDLEAEALARPGATPMDITGKPMRGIIWVDAREAIDAGLENWVEFAVRFVGRLPPK